MRSRTPRRSGGSRDNCAPRARRGPTSGIPLPLAALRSILLPAFLSILLAALLSPSAQGQRIRERQDEPARVGKPEPRHGGPRVEISEGEDSSATIVVHRRHRESSDITDIVRVGENITIEAGQTVRGDVVAVGGTVTVLGHVRGDAVAIGGDVDLTGGGTVDGDAVSVGGTVKRGEG